MDVEECIKPHHLIFNFSSFSAYDSGSPIILPGDDESGHQDLLIGLVSWGELCADPVFPGTKPRAVYMPFLFVCLFVRKTNYTTREALGVNARVSEASDWIDATVCNISENPPTSFNCVSTKQPSTEDVPSALPSTRPRWEVLVILAGLVLVTFVLGKFLAKRKPIKKWLAKHSTEKQYLCQSNQSSPSSGDYMSVEIM